MATGELLDRTADEAGEANGTAEPATTAAVEAAQSKVAKPIKVLPTNRMALSKQFETLRAFAAASEPDRHAVTNIEASRLISLHASTVGLITTFFVDVGLLQKTADGFLPSAEVVEYKAALDWEDEAAGQKLAPAISKTWFATTLLPKLRMGPITDEVAIRDLAAVAKAGLIYKGQLETLLDYLLFAGVVVRDGNMLRLAKPQKAETGTDQTPAIKEERKEQPPAGGAVSGQTKPMGGGVQFNIALNVDMAELAGWTPDRITAFFAGIAQVMAAKGKLEEGSR